MADAVETNLEQNEGTENKQTNEQELFSGDYVRALRKEAEKYRKERNGYADTIKSILKVDDLDGLDGKVKAYTDSVQSELAAANNKVNDYIISQEIKRALGDNYTAAAVKLLDRSNIKVDDGKVSGLTEAIAQLEKDYPEVKKTKADKLADGTGNDKIGKDDNDTAVKNFRKALGLEDK